MSGYKFNINERIAIAITAATRNDFEPFKKVIAELKANNWTDEKIGRKFIEIGEIMFSEYR